MSVSRCIWCKDHALMTQYHDEEWGVPLHDDQQLFEFLILEGAQAGLSWSTILARRENYRAAFDQFDAEKIARYNARRIESLMKNPGIIRNTLKVNAAVKNARAFLAIKEHHNSFDEYIWQFVDGRPINNAWKTHTQIPVATTESKKMAKELRKLGFGFVGETICYAFMQATGMVNDHTTDCFRHSEIAKR